MFLESKQEIIEQSGTSEGDQLILEACIQELGIELNESEMQELTDKSLLSERNIIKLDKLTKKGIAERRAILVIAKEKNDPVYKKLVMIYRMKKKAIDLLTKKYGNAARQRVRKNMSSFKKISSANLTSKVSNAVAAQGNVFKGSDLPTKK